MDAESKTRLMELIKDADDELVKKILQTINRVADKVRECIETRLSPHSTVILIIQEFCLVKIDSEEDHRLFQLPDDHY